MSETLLQVQDVHAGYGRMEVLRGVSLQVQAGEMVALLGSNGAGKTTLNTVMCGLLPLRSGQVRFDGQDLTGQHYRRVVEAGLILVPEGRKIFPNLDIRENLLLGAYARARDHRSANLERVFELFPRLRERSQQLAGTLSGGEQFCASLSLALGLSDVVLSNASGLSIDTFFIDEGFGSLDSGRLSQVMQMLDGLKADGRAVGLISHVEELKTAITERIDVRQDESTNMSTLSVNWMK